MLGIDFFYCYLKYILYDNYCCWQVSTNLINLQIFKTVF